MRLKRCGIAVILLLLVGLLPCPSISANQAEVSQLKAVFVLNFAKLAEWPPASFSEAGIVTIAIIGKLPPTAFMNILKGQTVQGRTVAVKHIDSMRQAKGSQLLYLSGIERNKVPVLLKEVQLLPILTVSDIGGFCEAGGMIGLVPVNNRLGFEVNMASVRKAHLTLSSQILKLAKTIIGN